LFTQVTVNYLNLLQLRHRQSTRRYG
jgi:hypothetical protein